MEMEMKTQTEMNSAYHAINELFLEWDNSRGFTFPR